jgi:hypothetical protein
MADVEGGKTGINVEAVRAYMFSEDWNLPEAIEKKRNNPDRIADLNEEFPVTESGSI